MGTVKTKSILAIAAAMLLHLLPLEASHAQPAPVDEAKPAAPSPEQLEEARTQFSTGRALLEQGKLDEAIVAFRASHAAAGRPSALFMLGVSYRRRFEARGELSDAKLSLEHYGKFMERAPEHSKVAEARETTTLLQSLVAGAEKRKAAGANITTLMGSREFRQAVGLFGEGRYGEAIEAGLAARTNSIAGPEEVSQIWVIIGRAQALAGDIEASVRSFQNALSMNPNIRVMADIDAMDAAAFEKARVALRGKAPLAISARGQGVVRRGGEISVTLDVDSDPMKLVDKLVFYYRWAESDSFVELPGEHGSAINIPPPTTPQERVFYYLTALDGAGAVIANSGTARAPLSLKVVSKLEWKRQNPTPDSGSAVLRLGGIASMAAGTGSIIFGVLQGLKASEINDELHEMASAGVWGDDGASRFGEAKDAERNMLILVSAGSAAIIGGGLLYYLGRPGAGPEGTHMAITAGGDSQSGIISLSGAF